jgi:hypothetical protein
MKSASGYANDGLLGHLENHLRNWSGPGRDPWKVVCSSSTIKHRLPVSDRRAAVYERPEFVDRLPAPLVSTPQLFEWRRTEDCNGIRENGLPALKLIGPLFPLTRNRQERPLFRRAYSSALVDVVHHETD